MVKVAYRFNSHTEFYFERTYFSYQNWLRKYLSLTAQEMEFRFKNRVKIEFLPGGGGFLTREVTGVCGKALHTLYPVA